MEPWGDSAGQWGCSRGKVTWSYRGEKKSHLPDETCTRKGAEPATPTDCPRRRTKIVFSTAWRTADGSRSVRVTLPQSAAKVIKNPQESRSAPHWNFSWMFCWAKKKTAIGYIQDRREALSYRRTPSPLHDALWIPVVSYFVVTQVSLSECQRIRLFNNSKHHVREIWASGHSYAACVKTVVQTWLCRWDRWTPLAVHTSAFRISQQFSVCLGGFFSGENRRRLARAASFHEFLQRTVAMGRVLPTEAQLKESPETTEPQKTEFLWDQIIFGCLTIPYFLKPQSSDEYDAFLSFLCFSVDCTFGRDFKGSCSVEYKAWKDFF